MERGYITQSPCSAVRPPGKILSRNRVLTEDEIRNVWSCVHQMEFPFSPFVKLLLLTAQRRSEVIGMRWSELNFLERVWTIPAERNKKGREHAVPLSATAMTILLSLPKVHPIYVFPSSRGDRSASGFSKWKAKFDSICPVADWTLHDLRRTAATEMARLGVDLHIIERSLNHLSGALGGVAGIYNRFNYREQIRDAFEKWDRQVIAINQSPEPKPNCAQSTK